MLLVRRQRRASSASCAGLQSRQLHADTGSAGGNQALVVDQPAGETREDRSKSGAPWPLRHIPDGRGRGAEGIVPGDSAADRGTTATATTSACVRRPIVMRSRATDGRSASQCQGKWPDHSPRPPFGPPVVPVAVRTSRLSCSKAVKREYSRQFGSHLENPG